MCPLEGDEGVLHLMQLNSTVPHSADGKESNQRSCLLVEVEVELCSDSAECYFTKCSVIVTVSKRLLLPAAFNAEYRRLHQLEHQIKLMLPFSMV